MKWWCDDGVPLTAGEAPEFDGIERREEPGQWEPTQCVRLPAESSTVYTRRPILREW